MIDGDIILVSVSLMSVSLKYPRQTGNRKYIIFQIPHPAVQTGPSTPLSLHVITCSGPHIRNRGIACHVRECVVFLFCTRFLLPSEPVCGEGEPSFLDGLD